MKNAVRHVGGSLSIALVGLLVAVVGINLVIYLQTHTYRYADIAEVPSAQVALIPGAPLLATGVLSSIFIDRIEKAVALYQAGKVQKILVSGDNSTVSHNEVNPARTYLIKRGIPAEDIFLDHAGFDTYSSMYRARHIFGVSSLVVSTQSFHLPRAVFIARNLGIEAYGVSADEGRILFRNYAREILANEKAVLELLFRVQPKFLGEPIPITGDSPTYP